MALLFSYCPAFHPEEADRYNLLSPVVRIQLRSLLLKSSLTLLEIINLTTVEYVR